MPIDYFEKNSKQYNFMPSSKYQGRTYACLLSRRAFLGHAMRLAAAAALPAVLFDRGWLEGARAVEPDLKYETMNGLVAFFVPGPDQYSLVQGVSTEEPGGIDANITEALIVTLNLAQPPKVPLPPLSDTAAFVLYNYALMVNPDSANGPFFSTFANLSFRDKVEVFKRLEDSMWAPLASLLGFTASFLAYSEAGVFDSGKLTGWPVGWTISEYQGVSRGHDEFKGYFQNRRKTLARADSDSEGGEDNA